MCMAVKLDQRLLVFSLFRQHISNGIIKIYWLWKADGILRLYGGIVGPDYYNSYAVSVKHGTLYCTSWLIFPLFKQTKNIMDLFFQCSPNDKILFSVF